MSHITHHTYLKPFIAKGLSAYDGVTYCYSHIYVPFLIHHTAFWL